MGYKEIFTAGRSSVKLLWSDGACRIFLPTRVKGVARRVSCVRPTQWGGSPSGIEGR